MPGTQPKFDVSANPPRPVPSASVLKALGKRNDRTNWSGPRPVFILSIYQYLILARRGQDAQIGAAFVDLLAAAELLARMAASEREGHVPAQPRQHVVHGHVGVHEGHQRGHLRQGV